MIKQKTPGSIVCTASISGHAVNFPQPQVAYNASKAAVIHTARCLGAEWAHHGIRVNSISPGYMNTILNEGDGLAEARALWAERNPFGRMGEPEELAGVVVMLCSVAGSYINATDIVVDGRCTFNRGRKLLLYSHVSLQAAASQSIESIANRAHRSPISRSICSLTSSNNQCR